NPRVLAEVTMMKIAQPMFDESKEALIKRIENLEKVIESGNIKVVAQSTENKDIDDNHHVEESITEEIVYEAVKSEDVNLIEASWKNILQRIKKDKKMPIYALLGEAKSFNVYSNMLYIVFDDNFGFAKAKLSADDTKEYIEKVIRETLNRSFSIKIVLKSEVKGIELEIKEKSLDKGEEILKNIVTEGILEIKNSIEENQDK
ncbi:DNA polymerase III subunit gamma/tau, partial [Romboutsia weinsteinii]